MWAQIAGVFAALCCAGCHDTIAVALDIPPEDLAVLSHERGGEVTSVVELRPGDQPEIELSEDEHAYVWIVAHANLVNLDGTPLPKDATLGADVRLHFEARASGKGSCGSCALPTDDPPQRLAPGDSCPLPKFSRVLDLVGDGADPIEIDASQLDALRTAILVDWPGSCP